MKEILLYDLVEKAQRGDSEALREILDYFHPYIKKISKQRKKQEWDDMENELILLVIKNILNYDMNRIPDFTEFFQMVTGYPPDYDL
ncbi:helix-turn-helix domain-containing protein [Xylanibacillus composti]|uniref:Helix-turn-helix conjugative transposon-like domain-containing protein n=1 Tax=Xylanibacillus composti TaxID=1572762 RepID=A0A8J4H825_9BACL|nr:helix-turn-helix domain-containing protein [Xylanibacillus composti]MDT9725422.1 helix-turn-helix domain-containing protein [Xylanibacillus composti]GIQ71551.1 hypothetical protein XYCOK13_43750 [Xylanibacillus composti]